MILKFEPRLMEQMVLDVARRDLAFRQICRERLDAVYELSEEERADEFARVYQRLFEERGLGSEIAAQLDEFPMLEKHIEQVLVLQAQSQREQEVELSPDHTRLGIRVRMDLLTNPARLAPFLHHELTRIVDLLDETFGYRAERVGNSPAEEAMLRERYGLLWDISIDSRLEHAGKIAEANREQWFRPFERTFSFMPARERRVVFEALWENARVTHAQLLRWAREPITFAQDLAGKLETNYTAPLPGGLCPLCRFPTFAWVKPTPEIIPAIKSDFPDWRAEDGLCERCLECYQTAASHWRIEFVA